MSLRIGGTQACLWALVLALVGCGGDASPRPAEELDPAQGRANVLLAAGDIAECELEGDEATASLIAEQPGTVLALGDTAYEYGTPEQFDECYEPSWGQFKGRTRPAPGNHEYGTADAAGYFDYFGEAAGEPGDGWYAFAQSGWQLIALNSVCEEVGCDAGSPQLRWLERELERSDAECTLAYFHHPRFSSGSEHGDHPEMAPIWRILYRHGVDVVLSGHDHNYERYEPLAPDGSVDEERGIRQFVVGTGGTELRPLGDIDEGSAASDDTTLGVLKLELEPDAYEWEFLPAADGTFTDSGAGSCHA